MFKRHWKVLVLLIVVSALWQTQTSLWEARKRERGHIFLDLQFENMKNQFTPGYKAWYADLDDFLAGESNGLLDMSPGKIFPTQGGQDLAIDGSGFFVVQLQGERLYTRDGRFSLKDGRFVHYSGAAVLAYPLDEHGNIAGDPRPLDSKYDSLSFDKRGILYGIEQVPNEASIIRQFPRSQLALGAPEHPQTMQRVPLTLFRETPQSGQVSLGVAGQDELGWVKPSSLELSNCDFYTLGAEIAKIRNRPASCRIETCDKEMCVQSRNAPRRLSPPSGKMMTMTEIGFPRENEILSDSGNEAARLKQNLDRLIADFPTHKSH